MIQVLAVEDPGKKHTVHTNTIDIEAITAFTLKEPLRICMGVTMAAKTVFQLS